MLIVVFLDNLDHFNECNVDSYSFCNKTLFSVYFDKCAFIEYQNVIFLLTL